MLQKVFWQKEEKIALNSPELEENRRSKPVVVNIIQLKQLDTKHYVNLTKFRNLFSNLKVTAPSSRCRRKYIK